MSSHDDFENGQDKFTKAFLLMATAFAGSAGIIGLLAMLLSLYEMAQHVFTAVGAGAGIGLTYRIGRRK